MQRIGGILRKFANEHGLESGLALSRIKQQWSALVGQTIASHTSPDTVKGKTILINVDTPQWMHHLSFYKQEILEKLRSYKLEEVRFRIGTVDAIPENKAQAEDIHLDGEELRYIENTVRNIKDEDIRERFRRLLIHSLRHQGK
ncbi:MAG: DUF721 domain-containing protein [Nitrospirae bacterium]|nr:DUF721 domain-containing protein [Nitrospirota bacterium]